LLAYSALAPIPLKFLACTKKYAAYFIYKLYRKSIRGGSYGLNALYFCTPLSSPYPDERLFPGAHG
jgi:hypothetical protein